MGEGGLIMASALQGQYGLGWHSKSFAAPIFFYLTCKSKIRTYIKQKGNEIIFGEAKVF